MVYITATETSYVVITSGIRPKIIIILYILQSRSSKDEIPAESLILSVDDVSLCMHASDKFHDSASEITNLKLLPRLVQSRGRLVISLAKSLKFN